MHKSLVEQGDIVLAQLLVPATLLLSLLLAASNAYAQTDPNGTTSQGDQKPAEEKQGGEYSGFEETGEQTEGLPGKEANPTPQAPISNLDVQQQNQTATTTETAGVAAENPASGTSGLMLLAGMGAIAAVAIVAAAWYFRKRAK